MTPTSGFYRHPIVIVWVRVRVNPNPNPNPVVLFAQTFSPLKSLFIALGR